MLPAEQNGQPDPEPVLPGHIPTQAYHLPIRGCDDEVDTHSNYSTVNDRTGEEEEAVHHDGLQVDEIHFSYNYQSGRNGARTETVNFAPKEKEFVTRSKPNTQRKSRKWLLVAAAVGLILLITASVLGGVLGPRHTRPGNSSSAEESQPSSTSTSSATNPTETSTVTLSSLKQGSSLSVSAWRSSQGLQIFLYYLSQNGRLRWSIYDDTQSSFAYNGSYWGISTEVVIESPESAAKDTSLAVGLLLYGTAHNVSCFLCTVYENSEGISPVNIATDAAI